MSCLPSIAILIVVVLYNKTISQSETLASLKIALEHAFANINCRILIYDNSPSVCGETLEVENVSVAYKHDETNPGICRAYNIAWQMAQRGPEEWLLLLDQDTDIPRDYFEMIDQHKNDFGEGVAVVPRIFTDGRLRSPVKVVNGIARDYLALSEDAKGVRSDEIMAINSASLISVKYLNKIGGFNEQFPLDYLDHWFYAKVFSDEQQVFVLDLDVQHDLSVCRFEEKIDVTRYDSILRSELLFFKKYRGPFVRLIYAVLLLRRSLAFFLKYKNKSFSLKTLQGAFVLLGSFLKP